MKYVQQQINEFTYTNLEDLYPVWDATKEYILETDENNLTDASMVLYNGWYYRSVTKSNIGLNPEEFDGNKWKKTTLSNKYAMLDMTSKTKSIMIEDNLVVEFKQGFIQTLAIGEYTANKFKIEIENSNGDNLYTYESTSTINAGVYDWWTYFFAPLGKTKDKAQMVNLPIRGDIIRITFIGRHENDTTSCGFLVGGKAVDMGCTLYGVRFSYVSYSKKEFDSRGAIKIEKRAVQEQVDFETVIESSKMVELRYNLKQVYDELVVFILDDRDKSNYDNLMVFGVIQDSEVLLDNGYETTISFNTLEVV